MDTKSTQVERVIQLGEVIARHGIRAAGVELLLLAHDARDAGVSPVLIDVMVDEDAPDVARARAFVLVGLRMSMLGALDSPITPQVEQSSRVLSAR